MSDGIYYIGSESDKKFLSRMERGLLYCKFGVWDARRMANVDNRKLAIVTIGQTRMMAAVDNVTMEGYRLDGMKMTWMKIKRFTFVRWARPMDI